MTYEHRSCSVFLGSAIALCLASCGETLLAPSPTLEPGPGDPVADGAAGIDGGTLGDLGMAGPIFAVPVRLVPQAGIGGRQRINLALPLARGQLIDAAWLQVRSGGREIGAARRVLARHPDGSVRSLQIQADVEVAGEGALEVRVGAPSSIDAPALVPVESTLSAQKTPRVWALHSADWLSKSGVFGPQVTEASVAGTALSATSKVCDYARFGTDAFLPLASDAAVWLFDRGTALYRGYGRRGDLLTLQSAYREATLYRDGLTGTGMALRIGVPGKADDLKYHYVQNLALHYLLTGDDRFREAAEGVAARVAALWTDPGYAGGSDFWTERHAGFALLAYVWAMVVSDDRGAEFRTLSDKAVEATLAVQDTYPRGYGDSGARCFAHSAEAHGEDYGYFGCSPWMSAILADGLDAYAEERGGAAAQRVRSALVKLGRGIARDGRDAQGRPFYWMGVPAGRAEGDPDEEHWGESAYVVAMAYHHQGRSDAALRKAAEELLAGLQKLGTAPHIRSFNWQCRSAVGAAYFLR